MFKVIKTGRTWSIVNANGNIVEGGFHIKEFADEACQEWNAGTRDD